jgi:hypothetical protein
MANVSKKEFEALKDSINVWVDATSGLFDCHKNRAADLSARVDALARTVGSLAEKSHAHTLKNGDTIELTITAATEYDSKVWPVAPEKPTPPKPKCPWCGGAAEWTARANHPIVGGEMITEHVCANTKCNRAFWV